MSSRKAKEAYLRKHGQGRLSREDCSGRSAGYSSTEEEPKSPKSPGVKAKEEGEKHESWAQKRKQHVLARATGERSPRAPEVPKQLGVSLTAVSFAAKLKESIKSKGKGEERPLSWKQKRALHYKLTHGVPRAPIEDLAVSTAAVLFAAKLKVRAGAARSAAAGGDGGGVVLKAGDGESASLALAQQKAAEVAAAVAKAKRESSGELSWTQRRKQAFLKKYGREKSGALEADVAVSAVTFAAKLKARQATTRRNSAAADGFTGI